jgi:chromosome partitioning protein
MRVIAIANQKGGSGKTTTAVNLAAALGEARRRVLLVDLDPQGSASSWYGIRNGSRGLLESLTDDRPLMDLIIESEAPGVEVIPSSPWLMGIEKMLAMEVGAELLLRSRIEKLPEGRWDFLLIDCPPTLGLLPISALSACTDVLVPVEAQIMPLAGLAGLVQTVQRVQDRLNPRVNITAILACRVDSRTRLSREVIGSLRERFGNLVLKAVVRENVRLAEAPSFARPITLYAPDSPGAQDYRAVASELLARFRRKTRP